MDKTKRLPTHLLRDYCIDYATKDWVPGKFVEIGPGSGITTERFLAKGFYGSCFDAAVESRDILRNNLVRYSENIRVAESFNELQVGTFDYLFSFDVIEHIENDKQVLNEWSNLLKTGGRILLSVPAHMSKFGKSDDLMGHYRRYEKQQLIELLKNEGYSDIVVYSYGFPLVNFTTPFINTLYKIFLRDVRQYSNLSTREKTLKSGIVSPNIAEILLFPFNKFTVLPFALLQKLFYKTDIGVAYVISGVKQVK